MREYLASLAPLDRALTWLLARPRRLQAAALLLTLLLVALALRAPNLPAPVPPPAAPVESAPTADEAAVLAVVAAYNQASIAAALLGRPDPMAAYLASTGSAWAQVQAEYARRATRGETHDPALTRWGVLRTAVAGDVATVETQEQWDDLTQLGDQIVASRRGLITRNTYQLHRVGGAWQIVTVTTTTFVG